jgi:metal-responsive CopG/Arc/MetJ family transcriptional regulator
MPSSTRSKRSGIVTAGGGAVVRASVSFPPDLYKSLNEIARRKKVSLAWVIREAAERYASIEQTTLKSPGRP